jgi:hypothetical protein
VLGRRRGDEEGWYLVLCCAGVWGVVFGVWYLVFDGGVSGFRDAGG